MTETNNDYKSTILYRNAKAVMDTLEAREQLLSAMQIEHKRLVAHVTQLEQRVAKAEHLVDTMWVKWMGHGSTE